MRKRRIINWIATAVAIAGLVSVVGAAAPVSAAPGTGITAGDRFNDTAPHFGGAFIFPTNSSTARSCTAGFSVIKNNGVPASVTAAHCAPNGVNYSSGGFYGQTQGQLLDGTHDMVRLESATPGSFSPRIHTGPSAPVTRIVRGRADPGDGALVCVSGAITEAKCDLRVLPGVHSLCYFTSTGFVCTHGLRMAERLNATVAQSGDSGGPVYTRSGADGAIINGMIIGRTDANHVLFHPISLVESGLGVRVMTG